MSDSCRRAACWAVLEFSFRLRRWRESSVLRRALWLLFIALILIIGGHQHLTCQLNVSLCTNIVWTIASQVRDGRPDSWNTSRAAVDERRITCLPSSLQIGRLMKGHSKSCHEASNTGICP